MSRRGRMVKTDIQRGRDECACDPMFTCGHCLRNGPIYFYGLSDGSAIAVGPLQGIGTTTPGAGA